MLLLGFDLYADCDQHCPALGFGHDLVYDSFHDLLAHGSLARLARQVVMRDVVVRFRGHWWAVDDPPICEFGSDVACDYLPPGGRHLGVDLSGHGILLE